MRDGDLNLAHHWLEIEHGMTLIGITIAVDEDWIFSSATGHSFAIAAFNSTLHKAGTHAVIIEIEKGGMKWSIAHNPGNGRSPDPVGNPFRVYILAPVKPPIFSILYRGLKEEKRLQGEIK